ncbi:MAG TPA: hypothetical protein VH684_18535 [Xanthobacteraceae bacterium]|jgi:hypothetical protein
MGVHPVLRLYEDVLAPGAPETAMRPLPRMIFVLLGSVAIGRQKVSSEQAWHSEAEAVLAPANGGATCWRFELAPPDTPENLCTGGGARSSLKLSASLSSLPDGDLLWRGDSVGFPPGGCAYLHRHQGPGIRCLIEGAIRIDTLGDSMHYAPGEAWYEAGLDPVFAQAAPDRPTRFIRVLILPRDLLGKSSIQYVNEADKVKPRSQQYKIFVDAPIVFRRSVST